MLGAIVYCCSKYVPIVIYTHLYNVKLRYRVDMHNIYVFEASVNRLMSMKTL